MFSARRNAACVWRQPLNPAPCKQCLQHIPHINVFQGHFFLYFCGQTFSRLSILGKQQLKLRKIDNILTLINSLPWDRSRDFRELANEQNEKMFRSALNDNFSVISLKLKCTQTFLGTQLYCLDASQQRAQWTVSNHYMQTPERGRAPITTSGNARWLNSFRALKDSRLDVVDQ